MSSTATLVYTAYLGRLSAAAAATLMGSVPIDPRLLSFYGLRVISDSTPTASPVVRTIVLGLNPVAGATATAKLVGRGDSGSPIDTVTVTGAGSGYVACPIVSFTGGRPPLPPDIDEAVISPELDAPGAAVAYLKAVSAAVVTGGAGYSPGTFIKVTGQLKSSGQPPPVGPPTDTGQPMVLTPTITLGVITAVAITSPGSGYIGVPTITVVDPSATPGAGAVVSVSMGVGEVLVLRGGSGYNAPPTVVLTPYFQALFPPASDQSAPLKNFMNTILEQVMKSPVAASPPVIA